MTRDSAAAVLRRQYERSLLGGSVRSVRGARAASGSVLGFWLMLALGLAIPVGAARLVYLGAFPALGVLLGLFTPVWLWMFLPHKRAWMASRSGSKEAARGRQ